MKKSINRRPTTNPQGFPDRTPAIAGAGSRNSPGSRFGNRSLARRSPPDNRDRVLAQWRGFDSRSEEIMRRSTEQAAGNLVGSVLKRLQLDRRIAESEIVKVWNHLIDATLTAHAQPSGIHNGTLFVNVDSSPWLDEIVRYRRKEILNRLQTAFGRELVQRISFRVA
jgi:hypothetical protein